MRTSALVASQVVHDEFYFNQACYDFSHVDCVCGLMGLCAPLLSVPPFHSIVHCESASLTRCDAGIQMELFWDYGSIALETMALSDFWLSILLVPLTALLVDLLSLVAGRYGFPNRMHILQVLLVGGSLVDVHVG